MTESSIARKPVREHPPGGGKFVTDEAEAQQPAAHGIALVLALQRGERCGASMQSPVIHRQAELNVGL